MQHYQCPQRDALFVMNEVLGFEKHYADLGFEDATPDMIQAIFAEKAKFTENVLAPINAIGDEQGCQWRDGVVTTPDGFKQAYAQYIEGGWPSLAQPVELGGQGLPYSLLATTDEWMSGANHAWAMYPGLSQGCIETIKAHGDEKLQQQYLPKLIEGTWTGTMCLTEAHCGSDLGMLKCKAEPDADGSYRLTGSKIFISAGEHDFSDNIVHIVLARLPDAPKGTKGISLFLVPKFTVTETGEKSERNQVNCGSIEHKMGIKASATCVINFDGAKGYLIGTENRGLHCMFTFMNVARIGTGIEGLSATEAAFQGALRYAKERLQFRSLTGAKNVQGAADPIIVHPDVRRMLLTQKALAEGNRALAIYCMQQVDIVRANQDEDSVKQADNKLYLLTPILKAFLTETAQEATSYGMQVYGGHGYIAEWGMEQLARDTRICTMYEGTTGIQALDLLGRKIAGSQGVLLKQFAEQILRDCQQVEGDDDLMQKARILSERVQEWQKVTAQIMQKAANNPDEIGAASVDYLMYAGYITVGYFWLKMAVVAKQKLAQGTEEADFYQAKLHTATFYYDRLLTRTHSLVASMATGADNLMAMQQEQFALGI